MNYLTLASGIEAPSVAWEPLGWTLHAVSEIADFPNAMLTHYHPDVPNLGDMEKSLKEGKYDQYRGQIDLVCGGSPCQAFSVAGLRKGLDDPRGNLALVFLGVVDRIRPRWVVFENVPGLLSSGRGNDFRCFIQGLAELGYGVAWRVLDAEYVRVQSGFPRAVPQRRRRVFVVGSLGDWRPAVAVLFESEGLRGNPPPRRGPGQEAPGPVEAGAGGGCEPGDLAEVFPMFLADNYRNRSNPVTHASMLVASETAPTLSARTKAGGGLGTDADCDGGLIASQAASPLTTRPYADQLSQEDSLVVFEPGNLRRRCGSPPQTGVCPTLGAEKTGDTFPHVAYGGNRTSGPLEVSTAQSAHQGRYDFESETFLVHGTQDPCVSKDAAFAVGRNTGQENVLVHAATVAPTAGASGPPYERTGNERVEADAVVVFQQNQRDEVRELAVPGAISSGHGMKQQNYICSPVAPTVSNQDWSVKGQNKEDALVIGGSYSVRRLTPLEVERLFGLPDHFTAIEFGRQRKIPRDEAEYYQRYGLQVEEVKGVFYTRIAADTPRYRALGNSMAINVVRWIGSRIQAFESLTRRV